MNPEIESFKTIVEKIPVGIIIFDKEGNPVYHNEAFEKMWGIQKEQLENYNLFQDRTLKSTNLLDQIKQVFEGKPNLFLEGYYDTLLEKGKGYTIWVETNIFPILDDKGSVEFVVVSHKDISEVKLAQEEIRIAKDEAAEANRLKNAFLANLSHEIRTPLNAIIGFGDLMLDIVKDKIDETELDLLSNFQIGIKRLYRTLTQILELSQIDTGNYQIQIEPVNLKDEVQRVINDLKSEAENKKLEFVLSLDENHLNILADKPALNRILTNLIENAIKFTEKGYIKIESFPNKNETILFCSIKDTGIGISEEYLDHIFEPFSQEEDGFNRPFEGNGLGLALTKRYLDLINSSITVDSVKGVGSTFTFTLPIYKD
ncbi:MAG: PAS domain-containing sensor histidine kinase [Ignavibacteria bacterium]